MCIEKLSIIAPFFLHFSTYSIHDLLFYWLDPVYVMLFERSLSLHSYATSWRVAHVWWCSKYFVVDLRFLFCHMTAVHVVISYMIDSLYTESLGRDVLKLHWTNKRRISFIPLFHISLLSSFRMLWLSEWQTEINQMLFSLRKSQPFFPCFDYWIPP